MELHGQRMKYDEVRRQAMDNVVRNTTEAIKPQTSSGIDIDAMVSTSGQPREYRSGGSPSYEECPNKWLGE